MVAPNSCNVQDDKVISEADEEYPQTNADTDHDNRYNSPIVRKQPKFKFTTLTYILALSGVVITGVTSLLSSPKVKGITTSLSSLERMPFFQNNLIFGNSKIASIRELLEVMETLRNNCEEQIEDSSMRSSVLQIIDTQIKDGRLLVSHQLNCEPLSSEVQQGYLDTISQLEERYRDTIDDLQYALSKSHTDEELYRWLVRVAIRERFQLPNDINRIDEDKVLLMLAETTCLSGIELTKERAFALRQEVNERKARQSIVIHGK